MAFEPMERLGCTDEIGEVFLYDVRSSSQRAAMKRISVFAHLVVEMAFQPSWSERSDDSWQPVGAAFDPRRAQACAAHLAEQSGAVRRHSTRTKDNSERNA